MQVRAGKQIRKSSILPSCLSEPRPRGCDTGRMVSAGPFLKKVKLRHGEIRLHVLGRAVLKPLWAPYLSSILKCSHIKHQM